MEWSSPSACSISWFWEEENMFFRIYSVLPHTILWTTAIWTYWRSLWWISPISELTCNPRRTIDTSQIYEEDYIRADILWHELQKVEDVNGKEKFGLMAKVAKLVLILPHSNADEERVFSIVRKNKTACRANLSLATTLPSILQCKLNALSHMKCYEYNPTHQVLRNAKQATWQYNREHANSSWLQCLHVLSLNVQCLRNVHPTPPPFPHI